MKILSADFLDRDTTCRDLGMGESSIVVDEDLGCGDQMRECSACISRQCMTWCRGIDPGLFAQSASESFGDALSEMGCDLGFPELIELLINLFEAGFRDPVDVEVCFSIAEPCGGEPSRDVHRSWS